MDLKASEGLAFLSLLALEGYILLPQNTLRENSVDQRGMKLQKIGS